MKPTVLVCTPAGTSVSTRFHCALVALMLATLRSGAVDAINQIVNTGSVLPMLRIQLADQACRVGASHVLFIDSDMAFPEDTLTRLLAHDRHIVAANCATKTSPPRPTAVGLDNTLLHTTGRSAGLERCAYVGTAVMLIATDVFRALSAPWFNTVYLAERDDFLTEDAYFCLKAREAGFEIWVDHDLSKQVAHVGDWDYRLVE